MPIEWYPKRWWNFCMSEDEKKKYNRFLLSNAFNTSVVHNLEVLEHFVIENHNLCMIFYDKMFQYFQIVYLI